MNHLNVDSSDISKIFTDNETPGVFDGNVELSFNTDINEEPYANLIKPLINNDTVNCDKIGFVSSDNSNECGIIAFNSNDPSAKFILTANGLKAPIVKVDELSLFGSKLGGDIMGKVYSDGYNLVLNIDVDGHVDNTIFDLKYDGKANYTVILPLNSSYYNSVQVTLNYGEKTLNYSASLTGSVNFEDGFYNYDRG